MDRALDMRDYDNQRAILLADERQRRNSPRLRRRFKKMQDSPFFGRVDFLYDGDEEAETFYIGIGNLSESAGSLPACV